MKTIQRLLLASSLAAITLLAGCNRPAGQAAREGRPNAVDPAAIARADALISQPAWLRERLPEHTVAYARIPSLWGAISAPDGRPLDVALAAEQHAKIVASLRKAAQSDPLLAQAGAGPLLQVLLGDQSSPIEVAVIDPSDGLSPYGRALVTTVVDLPDVAALNARIAALNPAGESPLQSPVDANGDATLRQFGAVHFDAPTHRLFLSLGSTASAMTLQQDLAQTRTTRTHPMMDAEREIDASGQGLFVWLAMKNLNTQLMAQLQDQPPDGLLRDALEHVQSIALGWGTVDGRGRLQLQVRAPQARLLGYLAPDIGEIDLKTSGKPAWAFTMALPGDRNLQAIHDHLDRDFGEGLGAKYDQLIAQLQAKVGTDPIAFARLFGTHAVMFSDANGRFVAVHVPDVKPLYAKFDEFAHRFAGKFEVLQSGDAQVHHLFLPGLNLGGQSGMDPQARAWMQLYARLGSHYYWIEDGHYLVFAAVPQGLADRVASHPDTPLGAWMHGQSHDAAHTLIGVTSTTHDMHREMYYAYLQALQAAGDLLGQPVDLSGLPSAGKLKLPVEGASGMALEANDQRLAFQMTYEQSPVEGLFGGQGSTTGMVAVVAILAAIAIPAYQDYVIRSQVSEGAALAEGSKVAVAEFYSNKGRMPRDNAEAGVATAESIIGNYVSSVRIEDGRIAVTYGEQANTALKGGVLMFTPAPQAGSVSWTCNTAAGTTVAIKYRPTACRQ
jgi:Tfp pilus assembly major pilin PilA